MRALPDAQLSNYVPLPLYWVDLGGTNNITYKGTEGELPGKGHEVTGPVDIESYSGRGGIFGAFFFSNRSRSAMVRVQVTLQYQLRGGAVAVWPLQLGSVVLPLLLMVAAGVGGWLAGTIQGWLMADVAQGAMAALRRDLFNHIQTLSLRFYDRQPIGAPSSSSRRRLAARPPA